MWVVGVLEPGVHAVLEPAGRPRRHDVAYGRVDVRARRAHSCVSAAHSCVSAEITHSCVSRHAVVVQGHRRRSAVRKRRDGHCQRANGVEERCEVFAGGERVDDRAESRHARERRGGWCARGCEETRREADAVWGARGHLEREGVVEVLVLVGEEEAPVRGGGVRVDERHGGWGRVVGGGGVVVSEHALDLERDGRAGLARALAPRRAQRRDVHGVLVRHGALARVSG